MSLYKLFTDTLTAGEEDWISLQKKSSIASSAKQSVACVNVGLGKLKQFEYQFFA